MAEQGEHRGPQDVVRSWTPKALEGLAEDADHRVRDQLAFVGLVAVQDVEAERAVTLGRVEQHQPILMRAWDSLEEIADQIALGINHTDTNAGLDVLQGEVHEQGAFAAPSRTDHPEVLAAIALRDMDRRALRVLQTGELAALTTGHGLRCNAYVS